MKINSNSQLNTQIKIESAPVNTENPTEIKIFGDSNNNLSLEKGEIFELINIEGISDDIKNEAFDNSFKKQVAIINTFLKVKENISETDVTNINEDIKEIQEQLKLKCRELQQTKPSMGLSENPEQKSNAPKPLTKSAQNFLEDCKNEKCTKARISIGNKVLEKKDGKIYLDEEEITIEKAQKELEKHSAELLEEFGSSAELFF